MDSLLTRVESFLVLDSALGDLTDLLGDHTNPPMDNAQYLTIIFSN